MPNISEYEKLNEQVINLQAELKFFKDQLRAFELENIRLVKVNNSLGGVEMSYDKQHINSEAYTKPLKYYDNNLDKRGLHSPF